MAVTTFGMTFLSFLAAVASIDDNLSSVYDFGQWQSRLLRDPADSQLALLTLDVIAAVALLNHDVAHRAEHCLE